LNVYYRWVVLALSATLALAFPAQGADVSLASKWKAGDETVFSYTSDSTRRDSVPAAQATKEQRTRQEMTIRRKVIETGPAGTTLELAFERIKVVITQGRMFMMFDSAKPPDPDRSNVLEDAIAPMIGTPLRVKLDAGDRVMEITGYPQPRTVDGAVRPLIVDDELVRNSLAGMYGLQKKPSSGKIGDRWTSEEELPGEKGTVLAIRHLRTLESADLEQAVINSKGTAEIRIVTPGTRPQQLMQSFDASTSHHWDHSKGVLKWMVLEQKIAMEGVVKQARSVHLSTVRITLASEGNTPPPAPTAPKDAAPGAGNPPPGSIAAPPR